MIINRKNRKPVSDGGTTLPTSMTLHELGNAMSQLDLSNVAPEKRKYAIRAHLLKIVAPKMDDRELGQEISVSHFDHLVEASQRQRNLIFGK